MELVFLSNKRGRCGRWQCGPRAFVLAFSGFAALLGLAGYVGYQMAASHSVATPVAAASPQHETILTQLAEQQRAIETARTDAQADLNALAQRLAHIQARVIRLDALGSRLVETSTLDPAEFDFTQTETGLGGPMPMAARSQSVPDFIADLDSLAAAIDDRSAKLEIMSEMLMLDRVNSDVSPAGRPIEKGWISSYYGKRTDPMTGKKAFHEGLDFAGKRGTDVVSVAAGIVTWAGRKSGYGNLVEVTHGNGLVTRYGHNQKNLVKAGDRVKKGEVIAKMGSSGRSTGPHVHFEVLKDGKHLNPLKFVKHQNKKG